jgi:hypothetical protein
MQTPINEMSLPVIMNAVHTMVDCRDHGPRSEAFSFIHFLTETTLSKILKAITEYIGFKKWTTTIGGTHVRAILHDKMWYYGKDGFLPPFSRPKILQVTLADYLWKTISQDDMEPPTYLGTTKILTQVDLNDEGFRSATATGSVVHN